MSHQTALNQLVTLLSLITPTQVAAQRTFDCYRNTNFSSASEAYRTHSDPTFCIGSFQDGWDLITRSNHLPQTIIAFIPVAIAVVVLVIFPIVWLLRCCCNCCASGRNAKTLSRASSGDPYAAENMKMEKGGGQNKDGKPDCCTWRYLSWPSVDRKAAICLLISAILVAVVWVICLSVQGTVRLPMSLERVARQLLDELTHGVEEVRIRLLLNPDTNPPDYIDPLTQADIDEFYNDVRNPAVREIDFYADMVRPYVTRSVLVGVFAGVFPPLLIGIAALVGVCLPCYRSNPAVYAATLHVTSCFSFLFIIFFGIVSGVFWLTANLVQDVCGERELFLQNPNAPGLISYLVLPACEENANSSFKDAEDRVIDGERQLAEVTCEQLLTLCDSDDAYNDRPYKCANLTQMNQCSDYYTARGTAATLTMKPAAPVRCGTVTGTTPYNVAEDYPNLPADYDQFLDKLVGSDGLIDVPNVDPNTAQFLCPVPTCANQCNDVDAAAGSQLTVAILEESDLVHQSRQENIDPYLSCRKVINKGLNRWTTCDDTVALLYILGACALLFMILLILLSVVIWMAMRNLDDSLCSVMAFACTCRRKEKPLVATAVGDNQTARIIQVTPVPTPVVLGMPLEEEPDVEEVEEPVPAQPRNPDEFLTDKHDIWISASRKKFGVNPMVRQMGEKIYNAENTDGIVTTVTRKRGDRVIESKRLESESQQRQSRATYSPPEGQIQPATRQTTPERGNYGFLHDVVKPKPQQEPQSAASEQATPKTTLHPRPSFAAPAAPEPSTPPTHVVTPTQVVTPTFVLPPPPPPPSHPPPSTAQPATGRARTLLDLARDQNEESLNGGGSMDF